MTPTNADDPLFDDVMWVENAQRDHADLVNKLINRGVQVVELREPLAETMAIPGARTRLLDREIVSNQVGPGSPSPSHSAPRAMAAAVQR